jgi:NAD-dependent dihydropyrimidine dehydrogenase PreA subunit
VNTMKVAGKVYGFIVASLLGLPMVAALLVWLADGSARGRFDGAHIFSARYISSVVVFMVLLLPFFWMADRRTPGESLTWGEAMVAAAYVFGLLFWLYGVIPHEYLNWADSELSWRPDKKVIGPEGTWTWLERGALDVDPPHDPQADLPRRHRGAALRRRPGWLHLGLRLLERSSEEGCRRGRSREGVHLRPAARGQALTAHRCQPPDAGVPHRLRARRGRCGLPGQGGQAQAVHPHRPVRVHHVRGLRRHLSVEVHPHGQPVVDRRGRGHRAPGVDPSDNVVFLIDDDVCTRCALCVDRCPTGVIILGKIGDPAANGDGHQRTNTHGYGYGMRLG